MGRVLVAVLLCVAVAGFVFACEKAEKAKAADKVVTGVVKVTKDAAGVATSTITAKEADKDVVYAVAADSPAAAKVAELDGKTVDAKGVVAEKDGKKTITVKEVKEAAAKK
jgi:hypothetical protein